MRYGLACVEHNHRAYLVRTFYNRRDVGDGTGCVAHMGDGHDLCAFGDHLVRSVGKRCDRHCPDRTISASLRYARQAPNGNSTEWCSALDTTISSPGFRQKRLAASPPRPSDALPNAVASKFSPAVAPEVTTISSSPSAKLAPTRRADFGTCLFERHGAACGKLMRSTMHAGVDGTVKSLSASITHCGFWEVAAESKYTSGWPWIS